MDKFQGWLLEQDGDLYKCKCEFASARVDNFQRHVNETHLKILKVCKCGAKVTASSLSRHKKFHCPKKNSIVHSDQTPNQTPIGMITPPPETDAPPLDLNTPPPDLNTSLHEQPSSPQTIDQKPSPDESAVVHESPASHVKDYRVESFTVRFEQTLDGTLFITHDDIEIGGILFRLAPKEL